MSDAVFPCETLQRRDPLASVRVRGGVSAAFIADGGISRIASLAEHGGYRLKFPTPVGSGIEAVVVNTGGGVAGGDCVQMEYAALAGAVVTVSTVTAERIYRSTADASAIDVRLRVADAATLAWMPQATILFSGARLQRRFEVDLATDARLLMTEATVFGRPARGEVMGDGLLRDQWRIRRDGRLIFAEASTLAGEIAKTLSRSAVTGGATGVALLLCVSPDAEDRCDVVRAALEGCGIEAGVSAWNGMLVVRVIGSRLDVLQNALRCATAALQLCPVPQVWPQIWPQ